MLSGSPVILLKQITHSMMVLGLLRCEDVRELFDTEERETIIKSCQLLEGSATCNPRIMKEKTEIHARSLFTEFFEKFY